MVVCSKTIQSIETSNSQTCLSGLVTELELKAKHETDIKKPAFMKGWKAILNNIRITWRHDLAKMWIESFHSMQKVILLRYGFA